MRPHWLTFHNMVQLSYIMVHYEYIVNLKLSKLYTFHRKEKQCENIVTLRDRSHYNPRLVPYYNSELSLLQSQKCLFNYPGHAAFF